jgi:hypothetical protein
MDLYPHQKEALDRLKNGSILWGGVGVGKSAVAMAYYMRYEAPRRVFVITTAKKRDSLDWEAEATVYGVGREVSTQGLLVVDSWNNIGKYEDVTDAFFIFDEQRLVGSGSWAKAFLRIAKHNRWILLSATPGDNWLDYIPVFVANGFYKNRTEFKREHVIYSSYSKFPKVEGYLGTGKLINYRRRILVEMPYERTTQRHTHDVFVKYNADMFAEVRKTRWDIYRDRPVRDAARLFGVLRRLVNSDPSRLVEVERLRTIHDRIIVFYNFDYELEILRGLGGVVAEWNGHKHDPIPDTERWIYLVQYTAGAEGWNCVTTNAMIFYSLTYSYKQFHQAMGRIDRLNAAFSDLHYYIFRSEAFVDQLVIRALKAKKNFNVVKTAAKCL